MSLESSDESPAQEEPIEVEGNQRQRFVLSNDSTQRLDVYLHNRLKGISRHQIQKLIALGGVHVNGNTPKASTRLKQDDVIDLWMPPRPSVELNPQPLALDIIHEEPGFIVINKQAGLIVHPARSHLTGTLLNGLAHHFQKENETLSSVGSDQARPGVIHRLDMNTTGVIIVAKQDEPHWIIAKQFENRKVLKAYLAVVHGCPDPPGGVIDQPIGKHPTIREAHSIRHDSSGKASVTLYRVRQRYRGYSLMELELKTGRTHQIRVHLSYIGHPLAGDLLYGGELIGPDQIENPPHAAGSRPHVAFARSKEEGQKLEAWAAGRPDVLMATPALHAALLRIYHPETAEPTTFTAPVHDAMRTLINRLSQHPADGPVVHEGWHVDLDSALSNEH